MESEYITGGSCLSSRRRDQFLSYLIPALNLLPYQLVEILFARGLVKILFATETFAMVSHYDLRSLLCLDTVRTLLAGRQYARQMRRIFGHSKTRRTQLP